MSQKTAKKEPKYEFSGGKKTVAMKINAITAMKESFFNVAFVCKQLNMHRRSFYRWKKLDPEFERACEETLEEIYDDAETALQRKIHQDKDTASLIFFLKTKCKQRGYVEKREIEYSGEIKPAVFNLIEKSPEEIKSDKLANKSKAEGNAPGTG